jgi:2-methylcitrate dehydratase PrpD
VSAERSEGAWTFTVQDNGIGVPEEHVDRVFQIFQRLHSRSEYEGKFSLQYSVASMLVRGHVAVSDFTDEAIADPAVLAVAQKVRYETPEYPTYPQAFPGGVRVTLAGGETIEGDFPFQKGGPENPLSAGEVREKFPARVARAPTRDLSSRRPPRARRRRAT